MTDGGRSDGAVPAASTSLGAGPFAADDVHRLRVALGRISRRVDRNSRPAELTRTAFLLLNTVARRGPLSMGELAAIEGLNPTMASRLVGKLADRGLMARAPRAEDRRVVTVRATEEGLKLYHRLRAERAAMFSAHLAALPEDVAAALRAALPALEALADHIPPAPESDTAPGYDTAPDAGSVPGADSEPTPDARR